MANLVSRSRRIVLLLVGLAALALVAYIVFPGEEAPPTPAPTPRTAQPDPPAGPQLAGIAADVHASGGALALPEPLPELISLRVELTGLCIDEAGEPVSSATVLALLPHASARWNEDATLATATTDGTGQFRFAPEELPEDLESLRLVAWQGADGLSTERPLVTPIRPQGELLLELSTSHVVTGRVVPDHDVPTTSIRVKAVSEYFPEYPAARVVRVDDTGWFAIPGCRRFVHLQAVAPGRQASDTLLVAVDAYRDDRPTLVLGPPGSRARLRLVDEQGAPLPHGVQALAGVAGAILAGYAVGDDGMLDVEGVDATQPLRVSVPDQRVGRTDRWLAGTYADVPPQALSTTPPWTLTVGRSLSVSVRLRDVEGSPIPDKPLLLVKGPDQSVAGREELMAARGTTDVEGEVVLSRLHALSPGDYTLKAAGGGHVLWSGELRQPEERIEVTWAGPERMLPLFECLRADGQHLRDARIEIDAIHVATGPNSTSAGRIGRDAMGPDGVLRLLVQAPPPQANQRILYRPRLDGRELRRDAYDLMPPESGASGRLQLRRGAYGSVALELRRGDHPLQGAHAILRGEGTAFAHAPAPSDDQGLVHFGVVPIGTWRMEIRSGTTSTFLRTPLDVVADRTTTRTIDIAEAR